MQAGPRLRHTVAAAGSGQARAAAAERAGVLFGQLHGLSLTAAEAARCFEVQPRAPTSPSFEPAIGVLAELFAAGSKSSGPAEQLVGSLLRGQPSAVSLLTYGAETLQERIDSLLGLGFSKAQLVAAMRRSRAVLIVSPARLAALAGVLQQELGAGRELCAKLLRCAPRVFGQQKTLDMVGREPALLGIDSSVWQSALVVMQRCGLTEERALEVASNNPSALQNNWLAAGLLANRLALQRCLQLTAGQVYERHAGYIAGHSAYRLFGRLLFLQQHGLQHLLVAEKKELLQQWRRRQHNFWAVTG
ncbi:hypothetical protein ABPG77_009877 [Micractinium sp. CCAP 211/92]